MNAFFLLWFGAACAVAILLIRSRSQLSGDCAGKGFKALAACFVSLAFVNVFLPDLFSMRGIGLYNTPDDFFFTYRDPWHALLRWGNAAAVIVLPVSVFWRKRQLSRVSAFVVLPCSAISAACFNRYLAYFTSPSAPSVFGEASRAILQNPSFRAAFLMLLLMLEFTCAAYVTLRDLRLLPFAGAKDAGLFLAVLAGSVLSNIPIYVPQHLAGCYSDIILSFGRNGHILFIAAVIAEGLLLHFLFRRQSRDNKLILLFMLALSLLFQYNTFFRTDSVITASRMPFQLCNIAGAMLISVLLTRSKRLYHFTLVINSIGSAIAIILCNSTQDTGILYCMNIHYMAEHINVLLVPVLMGSLQVFPPLKKRDLKDVFAGFTVYFAVVLIAGTVFTSLYRKTGSDYYSGVNYLFMFNVDESAGMLPFTAALFDCSFPIGPYVSFSLVQPCVYAAFLLLCTGFFFLLYLFLGEKKKNPSSAPAPCPADE